MLVRLHKSCAVWLALRQHAYAYRATAEHVAAGHGAMPGTSSAYRAASGSAVGARPRSMPYFQLICCTRTHGNTQLAAAGQQGAWEKHGRWQQRVEPGAGTSKAYRASSEGFADAKSRSIYAPLPADPAYVLNAGTKKLTVAAGSKSSTAQQAAAGKEPGTDRAYGAAAMHAAGGGLLHPAVLH